nr:hypothetical protein [Microbacterium bovistercoris]
MVSNEPIRLTGSDDEIVAVARRAWRVVAADREARGLLPALDQLGRQRRAYMAGFAAPTVAVAGSETAAPKGRPASSTAWYVLLALGLLAATVSAALAGPVMKRVTLEAATAVPVIFATLIAAVVLLAVALPAWLHRRPRSTGALTMVVVVGLIMVAVVIYRFVIGPAGGTTDFTGSQLAWWHAGAIVVVLELAVLALLVRPARDAAPNADAGRLRDQGRRLRADAARLARTDASDAVGREWARELDTLADVPAATRTQAQELGPVAWLAWTFYDGELDVSAVARP